MATEEQSAQQWTRPPPPFYRTDEVEDGQPVYAWGITPDEKARLTKLFGREFRETKLGGTYVTGAPVPCDGCGKWTEFIDWVYTAMQRNVHTPDFMFKALQNREFPKENMHDVYCSGCGKLTHVRSRNNAEGGAPTIGDAGPLIGDTTGYVARPDGPERMLFWVVRRAWFWLTDEKVKSIAPNTKPGPKWFVMGGWGMYDNLPAGVSWTGRRFWMIEDEEKPAKE